jgi:hypothetical protein
VNHTFVLCGLLVHHADWHVAQGALEEMRPTVRRRGVTCIVKGKGGADAPPDRNLGGS